MRQFADKSFDVTVAMETLEHIPDEALSEYLVQIARVTSGRFYITGPNEMGPIFMAKYLSKIVGRAVDQPYSLGEFLAAAAFHPGAVKRNQHKGRLPQAGA